MKLIEIKGCATWYTHDCEIPLNKRWGLMTLICILPVLNHKTYKHKVSSSINPRLWGQHQNKKMVPPLPTTRKKRLGWHSSDATLVSIHGCMHRPSNWLSNSPSSQEHLLHKTFPHWPQSTKEIKVALDKWWNSGQKSYIKQTVLLKVTASLDLDTLHWC